MPDFTELHRFLRERYGDPRKFLDGVRAQMAEHGVTQTQLAHRMGETQQHMHRWIKDNRPPRLLTMLLMDEAILELIAEVKENVTDESPAVGEN